MSDQKIKFEEEYQKSIEKQNSDPYFESKYPNKKANSKLMTILVTFAFALVFFVIIFCIVTAVNVDKVDTITVTIKYYDGEEKNQVLEKGEVFTISAVPTREGYKFVGWYLDEDYKTPFDSTTKIRSNTTIYAKWEIQSYTIKFDLDHVIKVVKYGEEFTIPQNTDFSNSNIAGWATREGSNVIVYKQGDKITMPAHDIVLYYVEN